jgi:2-dehydropantoate 2-reductase
MATDPTARAKFRRYWAFFSPGIASQPKNMAADHARLLVIGAGVNGSVCAAGLYRAGVDVSVLARGARIDAIKHDGIIIEDPLKQTRSVTFVPVIDVLRPDDVYDYILVTVRKNQAADLLPMLAHNRSPAVVFMLNNPSGPDLWIAALGRGRVLQGFAFAGGKRDDQIIRAIRVKSLSTPFGELDGSTTPRLTRLVAILRQAGFNATTSAHMTDWLVTHAAMVAPIGMLTLKHGTDTYALGRSWDDLRLLVEAWRDVLAVLRANGRRIVPASQNVIKWLPKFIVAASVRLLLSTRVGEIGLGWHCRQAPDEIHALAREVLILVDKSGLAVPAVRKVLSPVGTALL